MPAMAARTGKLHSIDGHPPMVGAFPSGCRFHPRCPALLSGEADAVATQCRTEPLAVLTGTVDHVAACHLVDRPQG